MRLVIGCTLLGALGSALVASPAGGDSHAASPGGRIAFVRFSAPVGHPRVYALSLRGGKAEPLPLPGVATAAPAWSRDGRRLTFIAGVNRPGTREIAGRVNVFVSGRDGRGARRVTRAAERAGSPAWSPDGQRIVFVKSAERGSLSSLWTVAAAGGRERRITNGAIDLEPSWAPNKRTIAFLRVDPKSYQGAVWVVRADGSGARRLFRAPGGEPVWSPDGSRLLLHDSRTIYTVRSDGRGRRAVARLNLDPHGAVEDPHPTWSPDGRWIAFCQLRSRGVEGSDIWIVRANGTGLHRIMRSPGVDTDPSWAP